MALVGFSAVTMGLQCHPVDAHGIVAVPEAHVFEPSIDSGFLLSQLFSYSALKRFLLDALMVFVQGGELSLLGGENEVSGMLFVN